VAREMALWFAAVALSSYFEPKSLDELLPA
jgi:hypothetical protein